MKYVFLFCLGLLQGQLQAQSQRPDRPNVLMIAIDDLNDFVGAMGHPDALTPNIDRLAERGVLFSNAHCQAPLCGPSRASLLTGLRPSSTGIYGMIADNDIKEVNQLTKRSPFLHEYFKEEGYYLLGVGKIFHQHFPDGLLDESGGGSDYGPRPDQKFKWDQKGTSTDWGVFPSAEEEMPDDHAASWAVEQLARKYDQPFFLSVGFIRPHVPWYVPQRWFDLYQPDQLHLPPYLAGDKDDLPSITSKIDDWPMMPTTEWAIQNNEWRNMLQAYLACISYADDNVGKVLDALSNSDYADNTIVVLWSDHGYRMGEKNTFAKVSLWERATKAPLIFAGPGIEMQKTVTHPVEMLDIYPTLTHLAGLNPIEANEGQSLVPLMNNEDVPWDKPVITTWGRNNSAVRSRAFRFIQYEDGSQELYDLKKDPNEWDNVAGQAQYKNVIEEMTAMLPKTNVAWSDRSFYNANEYFRNKGLEGY